MPVVRSFTGMSKHRHISGSYDAPRIRHGAGNGIRTRDHQAALKADKRRLASQISSHNRTFDTAAPSPMTAAQINEINSNHYGKKK